MKIIFLIISFMIMLENSAFAVWTDVYVSLNRDIPVTNGVLHEHVTYLINKEKAIGIVKAAVGEGELGTGSKEFAMTAPYSDAFGMLYAVQMILGHIKSYYRNKLLPEGEPSTDPINLGVKCCDQCQEIGHVTCTFQQKIQLQDATNLNLAIVAGFRNHENMQDCYLKYFGIDTGSEMGYPSDWVYIWNCTDGYSSVAYLGHGAPPINYSIDCYCEHPTVTYNQQGNIPDTSHQKISDLLETDPDGFQHPHDWSSLVRYTPNGTPYYYIPGDPPIVGTVGDLNPDPDTGTSTGPPVETPDPTSTTGATYSYQTPGDAVAPTFDTSIPQDMDVADVTKEEFKQIIKDNVLGFVQNIPVIGSVANLIANVHASSGDCMLTVSLVHQNVSFNFCKYTSWYAVFRALIETTTMLYGIFIVLKGG
jgi:hypothetical protein